MIDLSPFIFMVAMLIGLSLLAGKIRNIPYPILLVLAGVLVGFIPGLPVVRLDPAVVLLIFMPPLLFRSSWNTSWLDFKSAIRPISRLAIGLVICTTMTIAVVAHYLIPGFGWGAAFILGAVVSPPDAVSAVSLIRGLGLDKRIVTIIEGESLVNDASALVIYRSAVAAVVSGSFIFWKAGLQFLAVTVGGIVVGGLLGYGCCLILKKARSNPMAQNCLALLTPFICYLVAERFNMSGVLAVVVSGLVISWQSPRVFSYQGRTQSNVVWNMITFLLNGVIFLLIGLELSDVITNLQGFKLSSLLFHGLVISMAAIGIRFLFIMPASIFPRLRGKKQEQVFTWKNTLVLSWTGMRGVVSIATALALPLVTTSGTAFPHRNVILVLTFIIMVITLVGQGLTLPLLIKWLNFIPTNDQEDEELELRLLVIDQDIAFINSRISGIETDVQIVDQVRRLYELRFNWLKGNYLKENKALEAAISTGTVLERVIKAQLSVIEFNRELLVKFYRDGEYNADVIRKLEREMDLDESRLRSQLE
ncbi:CPA1 family monovalent cation:H+ antiporter [Mucilaginibacter gracilis]|uniref:CPA1 family monovalent cation:H+ antiporter n=1 Tax=Mucilaginibacter gracilis TaxID=423350 RepID=A0A495IVK6_9SPHI|nr:Na+/H+ antiporter [Mucilaginibacter gracilis]RKR80341.1 CPA1 family monovalent cation:H+ antiporter [Mucilaginibacter gracilis]